MVKKMSLAKEDLNKINGGYVELQKVLKETNKEGHLFDMTYLVIDNFTDAVVGAYNTLQEAQEADKIYHDHHQHPQPTSSTQCTIL